MTWTARLVTLGLTGVAGIIVFRCLPIKSRHHMTRAAGDWLTKRMVDHMGRMMASMPEGAPPKLVASILPKLQAQNEQIIGMLREQNELLRQQHRTAA